MLFLFSPSRLRSEQVDLHPCFAAARLSQYCAFQRTGCCSTSVDGRRVSSYASLEVSTAQGKGDEAEFESKSLISFHWESVGGDAVATDWAADESPQPALVCTVQYACSLRCKAELAARTGESIR